MCYNSIVGMLQEINLKLFNSRIGNRACPFLMSIFKSMSQAIHGKTSFQFII